MVVSGEEDGRGEVELQHDDFSEEDKDIIEEDYSLIEQDRSVYEE